MELLLLLLAVPLLWFVLWPARALAGAGMLAAVLVAGWMALGALWGPPGTTDYSTGDVQLRAMLD